MDTSNLIRDTLNFFNEIMVLYNLIGKREDIEIIINNDTHDIEFGLLMESVDDAKRLYEKLNNTVYNIYGMQFRITMTLSRDKINAHLVQIS